MLASSHQRTPLLYRKKSPPSTKLHAGGERGARSSRRDVQPVCVSVSIAGGLSVTAQFDALANTMASYRARVIDEAAACLMNLQMDSGSQMATDRQRFAPHSLASQRIEDDSGQANASLTIVSILIQVPTG